MSKVLSRRGRGNGSVIEAKRDGYWYIRLDLPRVNGKRQQRRETVKGTKADAQSRLRALQADLDRGVTGARDMLMRDLCRDWLTAKRHGTQTCTWERYEAQIRLHIEPTLGHLRVEEVRATHVRSALDRWMTAPSFWKTRKGEAGKPLSAISVGHILATLRMILAQAVEERIIPTNPAREKAVKSPRAAHREMQTATLAEIATLLREAEGTDLQAPIALLVATGLRRGEALGLRWSDIDFESRTLTVARSIERVGDEITSGRRDPVQVGENGKFGSYNSDP